MGALYDQDYSQPNAAPDAIARLVAAHRKGYGLARDFYMDPAVFARDMERVFRRHCIAWRMKA